MLPRRTRLLRPSLGRWQLLQGSIDATQHAADGRLLAVTAMPSNIFGPGARCSSSGPLLNALVSKAIAAKATGSPLVVAGTGRPKRQMLYSEDLARVLLWAIGGYNDSRAPLLVAGEEHRVQHLAELAARTVGYRGRLENDPSVPDGPLRRAVSDVRVRQLMPASSWTPTEAAVVATARSCAPGGAGQELLPTHARQLVDTEEEVQPCPLRKSNPSDAQMPLLAAEWNELHARVRLGKTLPDYKPLFSEGTGCPRAHRLDQPASNVQQLASTLGLAVTCLVRDAQPYLQRNLEAVVALGGAFARFWLFFVENDSKDRSKDILRGFLQRFPGIFKGELLDNVSSVRSTGMCAGRGLNCLARIRLLASLRQRTLDMALAQPGWDVLLGLDLDFRRFEADDFLQMVALGWRLNASAIFGQSVFRSSPGECAAYDTNAWRPLSTAPKHSSTATGLHAVWRVVGTQECFGAVESGHGGFSTYFAGALRAAKPRYILNKGPRDEVRGHAYCAVSRTSDCNDLVPFAKQVWDWGTQASRPLLADPRFRPIYALKSKAELQGLRGAGRARRVGVRGMRNGQGKGRTTRVESTPPAHGSWPSHAKMVAAARVS